MKLKIYELFLRKLTESVVLTNVFKNKYSKKLKF